MSITPLGVSIITITIFPSVLAMYLAPLAWSSPSHKDGRVLYAVLFSVSSYFLFFLELSSLITYIPHLPVFYVVFNILQPILTWVLLFDSYEEFCSSFCLYWLFCRITNLFFSKMIYPRIKSILFLTTLSLRELLLGVEIGFTLFLLFFLCISLRGFKLRYSRLLVRSPRMFADHAFVLYVISVAFNVVRLYRRNQDSFSHLGYALLAVFLLFFFVVYMDMRMRLENVKNESSFMKTAEEFQQKKLDQAAGSQAVIHTYLSEADSQLRELQALLEAPEVDTDLCSSHIRQMTNNPPILQKIYSGNLYVNTALSYFDEVCHRKGIRFSASASVPPTLALPADILTGILYNLLNNAVENIGTEDSFIEVRCEYKVQCLLMRVINSYDPDGEDEYTDEGSSEESLWPADLLLTADSFLPADGILTGISRKPGDHGYGLTIIRQMTQKYHGSFTMQFDPDSHTVTADAICSVPE